MAQQIPRVDLGWKCLELIAAQLSHPPLVSLHSALRRRASQQVSHPQRLQRRHLADLGRQCLELVVFAAVAPQLSVQPFDITTMLTHTVASLQQPPDCQSRSAVPSACCSSAVALASVNILHFTKRPSPQNSHSRKVPSAPPVLPISTGSASSWLPFSCPCASRTCQSLTLPFETTPPCSRHSLPASSTPSTCRSRSAASSTCCTYSYRTCQSTSYILSCYSPRESSCPAPARARPATPRGL